MNRSDRNPLRDGAGKGDAPKNCHNPKFRKNWEFIEWVTKMPVTKTNFKKRKKK